MALSMLGQHARAAECAERTQREFVAQGDVRAAGKVSLNLGSLHLRRDEFQQAAQHYREGCGAVRARRRSRALGDGRHRPGRRAHRAGRLRRGDAHLRAGRDARRALTACRCSKPWSRSRSRCSSSRAGTTAMRSPDSRGRAAATSSSACRRHLAIAEKQLADAYLELHLLPEALALFDQALTKFRALDMPDDEAWTLAQKGRAQVLLRRPGRRGRFAGARDRVVRGAGQRRRRGGGRARARRARASRRRCAGRRSRLASCRRTRFRRGGPAGPSRARRRGPRAGAAARGPGGRGACAVRRDARPGARTAAAAGAGPLPDRPGPGGAGRGRSGRRRGRRFERRVELFEDVAPHAARRRDSQRLPHRPPAALPGAAAHGHRRPRAAPVRLRSPPRSCGNSTACARVRWASGSRAARTGRRRASEDSADTAACEPGSTGCIAASAACRTTPCRRPC